VAEQRAARDEGEPMIRLAKVTKRYAGAATPIINELDLEIGAGELMVLVGPSGCGKTTTMRLINRLIEPTAGEIFVDGQNTESVPAAELRRRIGYVIQQIGLFPHLSVGSNIGMVPRALGWDRKRVRDRVDELLTLVGLEPSLYRRRHPRQLSGGQQQRVGVARALAADPPVLLMDEPFGAIDPINRERLQDEFLALQRQIRKTIVFVTHDIQEAVKMGDRIAIFAEGGRLAQLDTPARILAEPADDFVASFIGSGAAVRGLGLQRVADLPLEPATQATGSAVVRQDQSLHDALDAMLRARTDRVLVVGPDDQPLGTLPWSTVLAHRGDGPDEDRDKDPGRSD